MEKQMVMALWQVIVVYAHFKHSILAVKYGNLASYRVRGHFDFIFCHTHFFSVCMWGGNTFTPHISPSMKPFLV